MKYKTGDVEKILGISVETLRFFESIGLVKPERNEKNNYRYYEAVELNKMVAYKFFRGFEFSLEESIELVEGSNKLCQQKIQTQSKIIEDRIQYYQCLAWRLKELETSYQRINDLTGSIEKAKSPEILLYYNQYESEFAKDEIHIKTTKKWMEYLPFVYLSLYVKKEDCKIENSVHYGYGVNTIYKDLVKNLFTPCTRIIPSRLSLHTVVKTNGGFSLEMEDCEYIKKYIKETGLNISGDIIGWIINEEICESEKADKNEKIRYYEIFIPIS